MKHKPGDKVKIGISCGDKDMTIDDHRRGRLLNRAWHSRPSVALRYERFQSFGC